MWNEIDRRIRRAVHHLERKVMSTFADLANTLNGIAADVVPVQDGVTKLEATIATLQSQLANSGTSLPADAQASLDAAVQQAGTIKTAFDGVVAGLAAAADTAGQAASSQPSSTDPAQSGSGQTTG